MGTTIWTRKPEGGLPEGDIYFDGSHFWKNGIQGLVECKSFPLAGDGIVSSNPPKGKRKIYNVWVNEPPTGEKQAIIGYEYETDPEP